jgi:hypothetical protein
MHGTKNMKREDNKHNITETGNEQLSGKCQGIPRKERARSARFLFSELCCSAYVLFVSIVSFYVLFVSIVFFYVLFVSIVLFYVLFVSIVLFYVLFVSIVFFYVLIV